MHTLLNFTCLRIDRNTDADHSYTRCFAARIEFDFKRLQLAVTSNEEAKLVGVTDRNSESAEAVAGKI
jgi:hypothetical protein